MNTSKSKMIYRLARGNLVLYISVFEVPFGFGLSFVRESNVNRINLLPLTVIGIELSFIGLQEMVKESWTRGSPT